MKSISPVDEEEIRVLIKDFASAKEELHKLNTQKMQSIRQEEPRPDDEEKGTKRRTYSSPVGKAVGEKALENCRKISSIVNRVDPEISQELDKDIRMAS